MDNANSDFNITIGMGHSKWVPSCLKRISKYKEGHKDAVMDWLTYRFDFR